MQTDNGRQRYKEQGLKATSLGSCRYPLSYSPARVAKLVLGCILDSHFGEKKVVACSQRGTTRKSDGFRWTGHCDHCAISNHAAANCHRMSPTLTSTRVGHFGAKFGRKGMNDVNSILMRNGRDMGLSCAKEIVSMSSAVCAQCIFTENFAQIGQSTAEL